MIQPNLLPAASGGFLQDAQLAALDPEPPPGFIVALKKRLELGEMVTWIGRPQESPRHVVLDALLMRVLGGGFLIIAAGLLGAYVLSFEQWWSGPDRWNGTLAFTLGGLFFGGTGWIMWTSPRRERRRLARVRYVLTDRRALTFEPSWLGFRVRSFSPQTLRQLRREPGGANGAGSLVFGEEKRDEWTSAEFTGTRWIGFLGVADPDAVEKRIRTLIRHASRRASGG